MNYKSEDDFNPQQDLINKIAETAVSSQIESAEKIDVEIDSGILQLVQGKSKSLNISGERIIAFKDIQLEQLDITCNNLSLNLTQAILGKIYFEQPGDFQVKLILTQADCDRLLNSEYVKILLQNLPLNIAHHSATFWIEQAEAELGDNSKITLLATIVLVREQKIKKAKFQIALQLQQQGAAIKFGGGQYLEEEGFDLDETVALMSKISDLLYLRHFSNSDLSFDVTHLEIKNQQLHLSGEARVKKLPDSIDQSIKSVASKINNSEINN